MKHVSCILTTNFSSITVSGIIYEDNSTTKFCRTSDGDSPLCIMSYRLSCEEDIEAATDCIYKTGNFWAFVLLMSIGTIGFNVVNSISDAICFDVIGEFKQCCFCPNVHCDFF